jgi:catechol 1,2-dioxygenase
MNASKVDSAARERLRDVFPDLVETLKDFIRRREVSHEEYRQAVEFLCRVAQQDELRLFLDVFLEATVDQVDSAGRPGTATCVEGPYYVAGAPVLRSPCVLPHRASEPGQPMVFSGTVRGTDGEPLSGAVLDVWQADGAAAYSHFHIPKEEAPYNLRGQVIADELGRFEIQTWVSAVCHIRDNGPTGELLAVLGRHPMRPAHIHVKLTHETCLPLTTQLYFSNSPYLDSDVVGAVKAPLIVQLGKRDDPAEIARRGLKQPFHTLRYDFALPRRLAKAA